MSARPTRTAKSIAANEPEYPAARMHSLRWYEHQREFVKDKNQNVPRHGFLPFGGATYPLSTWASQGVPSVGADGSPTGFGVRHTPRHNSAFEHELGFFVPERTCQFQVHHQPSLNAQRPRFEPLRSHSGKGGGPALCDHGALPRSRLVWQQRELQRTVERRVSAAPMTRIQSSAVVPTMSSWHQLPPRHPRLGAASEEKLGW